MGKCPDCNAWDSLESHRPDPGAGRDPQKALVAGWAALADPGGGNAPASDVGGHQADARARPLDQIDDADITHRLSTGIGELDRVLGGDGQTRGLVPGSAVLIGGSPGIGKSTLLLQAAAALAAQGQRILYVSSEESARQIRARAERLRSGTAQGDGSNNLYILSDTNLARIVEQTRKVLPAVLIIDSVQMIYKSDLPAAPGSITQLRRCCADLVYLAKMSGIAVVLVGHVTKDGQLAGPRLLEHLVDAVLSFEGDRYHAHRLVRAVKNRFGTTQELGIFEMTAGGLREIPEGAGVPALEGAAEARPGSIVCPVMSGTRCILVEIQALTATGFLGAAKRKSSGLDSNRLAMIIAVLEQHLEMRLADRDIFASAVGGMRIVEPASDLALLLAIAGAQLRRALAPGTAVVGEVGLGGEVRTVTQLDGRLREAARLGYTRIIVPGVRSASRGKAKHAGDGVEVIPVRTISEATAELG